MPTMTQQQRDAAYRDRWARWKHRLDLQTATPVALIGVGHDAHSGELVICTCEEVSDEHLAGLLLRAAKALLAARRQP